MWQNLAAYGDAFMFEFEAMAGPTRLAGLDNQVSGQIVIGIHGYLDNAESLRVLAPYLSSCRYIAIDLAGHGRSSHRPDGMHYNQTDYLQDLHALIENEGWDDVILIGHSLGGILVTLYAALFPEKVKAVVSIDACGPLTESEETTQQQMRNALISRHGKSISQRRIVNIDDAVRARCKIADMTAEHARQILTRNMTKEADGNTFWCSDPKLRTKSILRLTEKQAQTLMESVSCPILFIGASKSFKNLPHVYEQRAHWFESAQYEQIVGGHHIHMEQSEVVGRLICQFVEQM